MCIISLDTRPARAHDGAVSTPNHERNSTMTRQIEAAAAAFSHGQQVAQERVRVGAFFRGSMGEARMHGYYGRGDIVARGAFMAGFADAIRASRIAVDADGYIISL